MTDFNFALRTLWKAKGFAAVAIATLAIGVGANTAIFSIVDSLLLRPLPFPQPDRLVRLFETEDAPGQFPFAGPDLGDWRTQNHTFQDMAMFGWAQSLNASGQGRPDAVKGVATEVNFFKVLGVQPLLGRTWAPDEGQAGKSRVTVLSYAFWKSRFGADPSVIGRTIELDARKYTIVGVMPESFRLPSRAQLWLPSEMVHNDYPRGSHWANAIGRMKPGVTIAAAKADLKVVAAALEKAYPDSNHKVGADVVGLADNLVGDSRGSLLLMLWAVALVLLIACANVANLLLSRAVARQKEMALRSALGAGRRRLVRQLLTESVLLGLAGGVAGLMLGWMIVSAFTHANSTALPQFTVIELNGTVLLFTLGLALATGILFGVIPALQASRPDLHEELKGGAGSSVSPSKKRRLASNILVVGEIALSLMLLAGAGLLLKDFVRLRNVEVGVRTEGVWTAAVQLPEAKYEHADQQSRFASALLEKARRIPGVDAAAISDRLPLEGGSNGYVKLRGRPSGPNSGPLVETHSVTPDYFSAMGIHLVSGRLFTAEELQLTERLNQLGHDADGKRRKLSPEQTNAMVYPSVINATMARQFWPNQDAVGQLYSWGADNGPWQRVVGVVGDVKQWSLTHEAVAEGYSAFGGDSSLYLVLHTRTDPAEATNAARRTLAELDASLPLIAVRTMSEVIDDGARGTQFLSLLVGSFAAFAALLAAVGIYGVLSYVVTQRTREIGIRMSLGASRGRVLGQVLSEGMQLAAIGSLIGIGAALAAGRVIASQLHEVKPNDLGVLAATTGLLLFVALAACVIPARRAARVDPMLALRHD